MRRSTSASCFFTFSASGPSGTFFKNARVAQPPQDISLSAPE